MGKLGVFTIVSILSLLTIFAFVVLSSKESDRESNLSSLERRGFDKQNEKALQIPKRKLASIEKIVTVPRRSPVPADWEERARASTGNITGDQFRERIALQKKQMKDLREGRTARLEALREKNPQGVKFAKRGGRYAFLPNVRAVAVTDAGDEALPNEIERSAGLVFVRVDSEEPFSGRQMPVVYNEKTARLGALTGHFTLKFKDAASFATVAQEHGLSLVQAFDPIQMVVAKTDKLQGEYLIRLLSTLEKDPRISRVTLEVKENLHVPN